MNEEEIFIVPEEINSEVKLLGDTWLPFVKNIYLKDAFIVFTIFVLSISSMNLFIPILKAPYFIFNLLLTFSLIRKSNDNLGKRRYESLYYYIKRDENTYHSIGLRGEYNEQKRQVIKKARKIRSKSS